MADDLHPLTVRISELTFEILKARGDADGIAPSSRLADMAEEWADRERHASNVIQRAIEGQQHAETRGNKA